jgi:hypothetical protein
MTMHTTITNNNFSSRLNGFKRSAGNMRQTAQELINYGLIRYRDHGDSGDLSRVYAAAADVKGINAATIKTYILDHANVKLRRDKNKNPVFRKLEKGIPAEVSEPESNWWEYKRETVTDSTVHVAKRMESIIKAMTRAEAKGDTVDLEAAEQALEALQKAIAERRTPDLKAVSGEPNF